MVGRSDSPDVARWLNVAERRTYILTINIVHKIYYETYVVLLKFLLLVSLEWWG